MTVDVITCVAPDLRKLKPLEYNAYENYELHVKRVKHIMHTAVFNGVDILITGAFVCGAFMNDSEVAAMTWNEALKDYRRKLDYIVFAIYFRQR